MRKLGLILLIGGLAACGDDGPSLEDFYPELPPEGGAQAAFAGAITAANTDELLTGVAAQGQVGDFYLRNDKVRITIGASTRVIGVVPQGGNLIDAALIGADGRQLLDDHFGELSLIYKAGRTCEHDRIEIVRDGTKGGAAVVRAVGKSGNNDFVNLKAIGALPIGDDLDPDIEDDIDCATTYVLEPGASQVAVHWSLYNPGAFKLQGPIGMLNDTGGETEAWSNTRGFERAGIEALDALTEPASINYVVYQGPGPAYGIVPRFEKPTHASGILIAGVSIVLFGAENLFDIFDPTTYELVLEPRKGMRQRVDVVLGRDAEDVDVVFRTGGGEAMSDVDGTAMWSDGTPAAGARVGVYLDGDGNGTIDDTDVVLSYLDAEADGRWSGKVPAGALLVRAEVKDQARSAVMPAGAGRALTLPAPVALDYQLLDDATGEPMPGRLLVVGTHPAFPDKRLFETKDRLAGIVRSVHAVAGTTTGAGADPAVLLPAGGTYRVYASRGTEWSAASAPFAGTARATVTLRLRRVIDTTGYLATEFHVHQVGSPDSPVGSLERVRSGLAAGVELFAVTDHDVVSDLQPFVETLGAQDLLRVIPGIEVTPFAYGHFNAWPLAVEPNSNGGAIDWGRGREGFAMTPGEIFDAMRTRGARVVQVNHPRGEGALGTFQQFFDRANLKYDFVGRSIFGDFLATPVPNQWLRLPDESLWNDTWNALEVWNGFSMSDTDGDRRREITSMDRVLRDWFNLLTMGFYAAPIGNSDSHTSVADPLGMPRTMVRVADDSGAALVSGAATAAVMSTLQGTGGVARDIVVTNGPMIAVTQNAMPAIGRVAAAANGMVTLVVTVTAPAWAEFDTVEIFANETPDSPIAPGGVVGLTPLKCWTSRALNTLHAMDPCTRAAIAPESMQVQSQTVGTGNGFRFLRAQVTITLAAADIRTRAGGTGTDAWLVIRARGDRGIFPILSGELVDELTLPILVSGTDQAVEAALQGHGVPAAAFTAPIFLDFDGNGYRAQFQP